MSSSAFFPAQFSITAYPSTSDATFYYDGSPLSCIPLSSLDGFVQPESSAWSHAVPLEWPHPESEPTSISDAELFRVLPTDELPHPELFSHELYVDPSCYPGPVRAPTHDTPYDFPHQVPQPEFDAYNVPIQYGALHFSTSQLAPVSHPHKPSPDVVGTPCISPILAELPVRFEDTLGRADDGITTEAALRTFRHVYTSHPANFRAGSDTPSPYPSPSPEPYTKASSELVACRRRNSPALPSTATSSSRWKCPHCPYVQRNRRSPDLKRHIETHTHHAHVAAWVCCGVPAENAVELGVPPEVVRDAPLFDFGGVTMVGGCRKVFSRQDALMRHLRKRTGACFGDAGALYQPGNRSALYG